MSNSWRPTKGREIQDITDKINGLSTSSKSVIEVISQSGNLSAVTSVNGKVGAVSLTSTDVGLGNVTNDAQLKRVGNDFNTFTEKSIPTKSDILLGEDATNSYSKIKIQFGNIPMYMNIDGNKSSIYNNSDNADGGAALMNFNTVDNFVSIAI